MTTAQAGEITSETRKTSPLVVLLQVAWMSILVGLFMQVAVTAALQLAGGPANEWSAFLRDAAQKVAWSTLVCAGIALGTVISNARVGVVGLAGMLAAPIAFVIAKTVQKSTGYALNAAPPEEMGTAIFVMMIALRAIEYGSLGLVLTWFARRPSAALRGFLGIGLAAGAIFGGTILAALYFNSHPRMTTPKVALTAVNEVIFPMCCALVLYASRVFGQLAGK